MKNILYAIFPLICSVATGDIWTQKGNFPAGNRLWPMSFEINGLAYMGCGNDYNTGYKQDFWEYDAANDSWTQKADFGGGARILTGFLINGKGYAGLGGNGISSFQDFWEYDPLSNTWVQKSDFTGGVGLSITTSFTINNHGYVPVVNASGISGIMEYEPVSDAWLQKANFPGIKFRNFASFSIGNKGYVGSGTDSLTGWFCQYFWEYDQPSDAWTQKANFPGPGRCDATGISILNKGYIGFGENNNYFSDFWEYDPQLNQWTQKLSLPGIGRKACGAFSVGNKGYIVCGYELKFGTIYTDVWEYNPDSTLLSGQEDLPGEVTLHVFPNPFRDNLTFNNLSADQTELIISDNLSRKVMHTTFSRSVTINTRELPIGNYFYEATNKNGIKKGKILKQ